MFHLPETRLRAFTYHLAISLFIFTSVACVVYFILFPGFLFYSEGGKLILTLIGGIDVVLGPLVTLVIYKKAKAGIKFDLSVIAVLQVAALCYGLYSLVSVRPIAVFYAEGTYQVVYESTFEDPFYFDKEGIDELNKIKPPLLAIKTPEGEDIEKLEFASLLTAEISYFSQKRLYMPYDTVIPSLKDSGMSLEQAEFSQVIKKGDFFQIAYKEHIRVFPYISSLKSGYVAIDTRNGNFVKAL